MSIFRRRDGVTSLPPSGGVLDSASVHSSPAQRRRVTHIAPGTRVQGQITGPTELIIDGEVEGEIRVDSAVAVGGDGVVKGPVSAQVVRVGGRVTGNIHAGERVEVAPSGSLEGDISAPRVVIAEGAFFKGRIEMRSGQDKSAPPVSQPAAQERPKERQERPERNDRPNGRPPKGDAGNGRGDAGNGQKA